MRSFEYVVQKSWGWTELRERIDLQLRRALARLVMSGVPPTELWMENRGDVVLVTAYGGAAAAIVVDRCGTTSELRVRVVARYIGRWEMLNA